jgi:D-aminoacyl-tRNA deacylase
MYLIVASNNDVAGINIAQQIIDHYMFEKTFESYQQNLLYSKNIKGKEIKLAFINEETIQAQRLIDHFSPKLLVFISRHSGVAGIPTLSVHTPGNLTEKANFGGLPRKVSIAPGSAMKNALLEMMRFKEESEMNYEILYECTHHGPSLDVPTMFAELGSSSEQWTDLKAAEVVAHAAISAILNEEKYPVVLGVGGPHYNVRFTKIALLTQVAFGHIVPKHSIPQVDDEMVAQCVRRTLEKVDHAIFDWKSMKGADRKRIATTLKELGVRVEKA